MNDVAPLLSAKLLPPTAGRFHLDRPRLIHRLGQGLGGRVTLITAGPGYGKTSLASRFLREIPGDWIWFRVDSSDRDPWILFRYLIQAVREHAPEFGERSEGIWEALRGQSNLAERAADTFMRDAEDSLTGTLVIVLDGLQAMEGSSPCFQAIRRLVQYLPGTLHMMLLSRSLPDLGARALAADASINVVSGQELLFTLEETGTLLRDSFGFEIDAAAISETQQRTRGWATALQLLRQTARLESPTAGLDQEVFARTEGEIFDYFSEEVLAAEPPDARRFLLEASLPATIDPDICSEVLVGLDVPAILESLIRKNLFISSLESRGSMYTFDPLFHEFLRRKLKGRATPAETRDLHQRYGRAFARRGDIALALGHWIAADDARHLLQALGRHGKGLLRAGLLTTVTDAAQILARRGSRSPIVEDLLGEACRLAGDYSTAIAHFERALAARAEGSAAQAGTPRASTLQGLAYSQLKMGRISDAARSIDQALAEVGEDDTVRARVLNTLSIIRYREERHDEALAGWHQALSCARLAGDEHLIRMIAHNLGLPHAVKGEFARASECFQILTSPDNPRLGPEEGAARLNLARIETIWGHYDRAASLLADAREIARTWRLSGLAADVMEAEGTLLRDRGDLDAAGDRYGKARGMFTELGRPDLVEGLVDEEAILAACRGDAAQAERIAAAAVARRRSAGDTAGLASALLALGEARARAGEGTKAAGLLDEAGTLFEGMGRCYQRCAASLWRALALHRAGEVTGAAKALAAGLELSDRNDYQALVLRVMRSMGVERGFAAWAATLAQAPAWLREAAGALPQEASRAPVPSSVDAPDLTIRLLGPIEVFRDERLKIPAHAWKIRRALHLFCFLASSRGHRAAKDRIADALWGEARPTVIEKNFHPTVSFLRRALNHGHAVPKNFILFESGAYLLNPAFAYEIDTEVFEAGIRAARRAAAAGQTSEAVRSYDAALRCYRGPFLEEEYDAWAETLRGHFESLYLASLGEAGELQITHGDPEIGLSWLRKLVERDALDEEASTRLMRALGRVGQRAGILKEFERLARSLKEDLDAEPMPETRRAHDEALEQSAKDVAGRAPRR